MRITTVSISIVLSLVLFGKILNAQDETSYSSSNFNVSYFAENAFDGNETTRWTSNDKTTDDTQLQHSFLCSDIGAQRVFKVSKSGEIEWEYPASHCTDAWMLDNGNVLMSFNEKESGVREVSPDKKIV